MNPPERIRPTASRRRRRMIIEDDDEGHNDQGEPSTVHEEDVVHEHMVHEQVDVHEQEEAAPAHEGEHMEEEHDGAEGPGELTRYPGGPYDLSVLTRYRYHVSARLWFGECWIYEYFPNICNRGDQGADVECFARMNRWCYKQGKHKVHEYRSIIDALTPADVIWRPWENHRGVIPFDDITLYTGHIRLCSTVAKYLPERCLRQFGYIQYIPSPPLPDPARLFDVDVEWLGYVTPVTELFPKLRPATYPSECEDGYLEWFYQVSHPLLVRPDGVPQVPRYSVPPTSADASSSQPPPILQQIGDLIQQGLSEHQASPDDELYRHFYKALYLSRSRTS
ncbi:uncharacterized protein [Cicer arietinum]|uniref:uncharacterized protein n=1 Tax=Cicer arietinum TaxID=3827 RepID=UPI003CC5BD67